MEPALSIQNLEKSFGGIRAVDRASFDVKPGKITALIGPNGAGKSTIFNLVTGILQPDKGELFLDGAVLVKSSPERISKMGVSRLFQQPRLFDNLSVRDNLMLATDGYRSGFWKNLLGLHKISEWKLSRIDELLEQLGLSGLADTPARVLSFGQKRLVELGRAILKPHKILLLDEPVAGVNPKLRKVIAGMLKRLKEKGETILLIEHDMPFTLGVSDEVVVMDEGRVIARGSPKRVVQSRKALAAYLGE